MNPSQSVFILMSLRVKFEFFIMPNTTQLQYGWAFHERVMTSLMEYEWLNDVHHVTYEMA